jgi:5'-phosphate synthase pdxT subunit
MVREIYIGVIGIQGAVFEHIISMRNVLDETNTPGKVFTVNKKEEIDNIDALLIPGGESTTISKILLKSDLYNAIFKRLEEKNLPIMGTCAGCVLLASKISNDSKDIKLLNALEMQVKRNAFGRQVESFEKNVNIEGFLNPYNAVFIRAPVIEKVWGGCKIMAKIGKKIVMAQQDNILAISFHPELTNDLRIHKYFLDMI